MHYLKSKKIIFLLIFFYLSASHTHKNQNHYVEIYNYQTFSPSKNYYSFSLLDFLFNIGTKEVIKIYRMMSKNPEEFNQKITLLKKIYHDFLTIKNKNEPIAEKVNQLLTVIHTLIQNSAERKRILEIYKKILYIFL